MGVRLVREDDQYLVFIGDVHLGVVYKARTHTDRYRFESPTLRGRTRWFASPGVNDEDFDTRKAAVEELVRRRAAQVSP